MFPGSMSLPSYSIPLGSLVSSIYTSRESDKAPLCQALSFLDRPSLCVWHWNLVPGGTAVYGAVALLLCAAVFE